MINRKLFNKYYLLNDIIKLNNYQVCYISTNPDKTSLYIIVFTLYKNDMLMNIRYYEIELWNNNEMKLFKEIKTTLYKNFISITFSHCYNISCDSNFDIILLLSF